MVYNPEMSCLPPDATTAHMWLLINNKKSAESWSEFCAGPSLILNALDHNEYERPRIIRKNTTNCTVDHKSQTISRQKFKGKADYIIVYHELNRLYRGKHRVRTRFLRFPCGFHHFSAPFQPILPCSYHKTSKNNYLDRLSISVCRL